MSLKRYDNLPTETKDSVFNAIDTYMYRSLILMAHTNTKSLTKKIVVYAVGEEDKPMKALIKLPKESIERLMREALERHSQNFRTATGRFASQRLMIESIRSVPEKIRVYKDAIEYVKDVLQSKIKKSPKKSTKRSPKK